jgi:septal ring factor EnvC (AmiA/AmiB activator)
MERLNLKFEIPSWMVEGIDIETVREALVAHQYRPTVLGGMVRGLLNELEKLRGQTGDGVTVKFGEGLGRLVHMSAEDVKKMRDDLDRSIYMLRLVNDCVPEQERTTDTVTGLAMFINKLRAQIESLVATIKSRDKEVAEERRKQNGLMVAIEYCLTCSRAEEDRLTRERDGAQAELKGMKENVLAEQKKIDELVREREALARLLPEGEATGPLLWDLERYVQKLKDTVFDQATELNKLRSAR